MAAIFPVRPGYVVGFRDPGLPASLKSAIQLEPEFTFEAQTAIVTAIGLQENCKHQFTETLNETIYGYSFGDEMGHFEFQGLAFFRKCADDEGDQDLGIVRTIQYYRANRFTRRTDPVKITIGSLTLEGFMVGSSHGVQDGTNNLFNFSFRMRVLPDSGGDA